MRLRIVIAMCLVPGVAHAEDVTTDRPSEPVERGEVRPSMLTPAARLPGRRERGTVAVSGGGAASHVMGGAEAVVGLVPRLALGVGLGDDGIGALTSTFSGAVQIVQGSVDLAGRVRYRTLGPEDAGGQVAGQLVLGASTKVVGFTTSALVARGVGVRNDVDAEGTAMAFVRPIAWLRIGAEGRVRGELAETYVTAEDEGRPIEVLAGGLVGFDVSGVLVQGLGGWSSPRGLASPGPVALGSVALAF